MATSGQAATRTSSRNTNATNDKDLINRAEAILAKSMQNKTSISGKSKNDLEAILDELITRLKRPSPTTTTTVTAASTEPATQTKKTGIDQATQTDEPTIVVCQSDINAINKKQDLIIKLLDKTYAQAAAGPQPITQQRQQTPAITERVIKAKKDLAQHDISLTTLEAARTVQETIQDLPPKNIMAALQEAINDANLEGKPQLEGVNKLRRGVIRMRAVTKEGAKAIREANINWDKAYEGIKAYKPKYGIVIHGVPSYSIDLEPGHTDQNDVQDIINKWQDDNANRNNVTIVGVKPLSRKPRSEYARTKHQSIIVFCDDAEAADRCIINGFLIDSQSLKAEKYAPHLQLKQCYKCHEFGHTAYNCAKNDQCGKCADNHPTSHCTSDTLKCANCGGPHEAWHFKCPTRCVAGNIAQDERERQSPFFCT
jgi:hypothetical protein